MMGATERFGAATAGTLVRTAVDAWTCYSGYRTTIHNLNQAASQSVSLDEFPSVHVLARVDILCPIWLRLNAGVRSSHHSQTETGERGTVSGR